MKTVKISKKGFEKALMNDFESSAVVQNPYIEDGKKLTLYYLIDGDKKNDIDLHIATWMSGEGWVFDHAQKHKLKKCELCGTKIASSEVYCSEKCEETDEMVLKADCQ